MCKSRVIGIAVLGVQLVLSVFIYIQIIEPVIQLSAKSKAEDLASRVPFDQALWLVGDNSHANPRRTQMVDDLLNRFDFHGMIEEEVIAKLGKPPTTDYFSDWDMVYWLGNERSYAPIDSE